MCGIAGVALTLAAPKDELLSCMAQALTHRGPDEQGAHVVDNVGLVHTRLSIIDLAGGHQPLFADDGNLVLVANGEIYNHIELRATLEACGHRFATHSDCETILHAYREYGDEFLNHLCGMFAFALYDRAQQRLLLVRDRLGMKPLFVAYHEQGVMFASEMKALLPAYDQKPEINPFALIQFLQNQNSTGRETMLSGIERVLPGEVVEIEQGKICKRWRYWSALNVAPRSLTLEDATEEFNQLMETVMPQHMRSDVPFGLFLSGGVDSTTLLGLLSHYKDEPINTYSVGFPGSKVGDELSTAEQLAKHFGSKHTVLTPDSQAMLHRLVHTVWAADDLMRDFANLPTSLLAEEAGKSLKVVFSGEGGDEAFAGYGRYRTRYAERWLKNVFVGGSGGFRTGGNFKPAMASAAFGDRLNAMQSGWRSPIIDAWRSCPAEWSDLQCMQHVDITTALPDNLLVKADRMLMAWSLEGRMPFVDHRVIEFGLSLPDELKLKDKQGKFFLKHWATQFLPTNHLWAKKRGFKVPVGEWLSGEYLMKIEKALLQSEVLASWFKLDGIQALVARQQRKGDVAKNIMAILQFAIWHKLFIEGNGQRPPALIDPVIFLETKNV